MKPKSHGGLRDEWIDTAMRRLPFPNQAAATEFSREITEDWGYATVELGATGKRGYVLLPPEHFKRLLTLWRRVWNDPLGRETTVVLEPGGKDTMADYLESSAQRPNMVRNVLSGVAVLVITAVIGQAVLSFANEKVQDDHIKSLKNQVSELRQRLYALETKP